MEKDPFLNFISDLSEKIKISREHKQIMERVNDPQSQIDESKSSLEALILTIKEKIDGATNKSAFASTEIIPITSNFVKIVSEEDNNFHDFVGKLKTILNKSKEQLPEISTPSLSSTAIDLAEQKKEENTSKKYLDILKQTTDKSKNTKTNNYVDELEKLKNGINVEKEDSKVTEIKKLIEEYAEKYIKKAVGIMGETGGGTVAVQYANGGTMNGDLNVNGNYLSGGVNLIDIFGTGVGDPFVNSVVYSNSGNWNSTYTTVYSNSANWDAAATGAVSKIIPGNNIAISPTIGTGIVTVNSTSINYLSTNRVSISGCDIISNLSVGVLYVSSFAPGTGDLNGYYYMTNQIQNGYPVFYNFSTGASIKWVEAGPAGWFIYNSNNQSVYYNTNTSPWIGSWLVVPGRPSPAADVSIFNPFINSLGTISVLNQGNSIQWNNTHSIVSVNSAYWDLGVEKVSALNIDNFNFDLSRYTVYSKRITGENVFTYQNFLTGQTLTIYLCANHPQALGHYFPINTYFGSHGNSNIAYTFSGYTTKLTIQNIGDYYLGSSFLIPYNVAQYQKLNDYMLEETIGFILLQDGGRIIL